MKKTMVPVATYRLQLNWQFTVDQCRSLLAYFRQLGISTVYSSPIFSAKINSLHGYDIINPERLNQQIANKKSLQKFIRNLHKQRMSLLLDVVPNHMSATIENSWWQSLMKKGLQSPYAKMFDVSWQKGKLNSYRRFLDINELVALRVDRLQVFKKTHHLLFSLINKSYVNGVRVDHVDGLRNPRQYLQRLTKAMPKSPYLVVEKILLDKESLPKNWPVAGTTGYDFLNAINVIFIDHSGYQLLLKNFQVVTKQTQSWREVTRQYKLEVMQELFAKEIKDLLKDILPIWKFENHTNARAEIFHRVIVEITAALPIYRSYIDNNGLSSDDQYYLQQAIKIAKNHLDDSDNKIISFFEGVVFLKIAKQKSACVNWLQKWQQLTAAVMAKAFEDRSCYTYNPLISLNEVGSYPAIVEHLGDIDYFHQFLRRRQINSAATLNASSTHDTKRSEDVRARINVLSEFPKEWLSHFRYFQKITRSFKNTDSDVNFPDAATELFLYQSLIGAWPINQRRFIPLMIKALREGNRMSNWHDPNIPREKLLKKFISSIYHSQEFFEKFDLFFKKIAFYGALNSLSALVIKITAPGIPDFYQGCEVWNFTLVDPDNRRSINYLSAEKLLRNVCEMADKSLPKLLTVLLRRWQNNALKIFVTYRCLNFRQKYAEFFNVANYLPLKITGNKKDCLLAFSRFSKCGTWVITIVPRFYSKLVAVGDFPLGKQVWLDTCIILPKTFPNKWVNIFDNNFLKITDGNYLPVAEVLTLFPLAILINELSNEPE